MKYSVIIILLTTLPLFSLKAQDIELTITGLESTKGQIVIGIFKDDPSFQKEEAFRSLTFPKKDILNGEMKVAFKMEPGLWGISLLDDENSSGLMEYNFLGIPKEGFGFSDYFTSGFSKPKFQSFSFTLEKDQKKKVTVKVRYI
ncbi:MAG: DUF2141 domain-containing protein [Bacteroidales bacterium]|jgi:uncharacterized protein (DUF2141 family)|nr:DUF2141 domain-containing protein [Bacteroidales bacterium]